MKSETVLVFPCPDLSPAEEAKAQMLTCAASLHVDAADAHAQGLYLERQAARLETLIELMSDEEMIQARDKCVEEGLIEVIPLSNLTPGGDA